MVRSDFKIDEDWERKLREMERREYGEREKKIGDKEENKICVQVQGVAVLFFIKKCSYKHNFTHTLNL